MRTIILFLCLFLCMGLVSSMPFNLPIEEFNDKDKSFDFSNSQNCLIEKMGHTDSILTKDKLEKFVISYDVDLTCLFIENIKKIGKLENEINELKLKVTQLETIVSQLTGTEIPKIETENKKQDEALCSIKLFDWCLIK